jgi:hypothetical protein
MDRSFAGWRYADQLFGPTGSYLHDEDQTMDWLYKARALIGVAILVAVGAHYHHATKSIISNFDPVLGGITEPMILALISVVPATALVVIFTRRGKRDEAFRQMMRYPVKVALICLIAYECVRVLERLVSMDNFLVNAVVIIVGGLIYFRYVLIFSFRAIYLITVGMCRLGDGHPLLPPVIGTILAWAVACQSLLTGGAGTGDPAMISLAVLLGGPVSITVLGHVEISGLRARYPEEFPFRDGPLPPPDSSARAKSAGPTKPSAQPANRRRYPWSLAIVSTIVPGIVVATYALYHSSSPAAVDTSISAIQDGQCIQYKPDPGVRIVSLPVVPCSAMHWGQVLGLISIGDAASAPYPGDDVAIQESGAVCAKAFDEAFGSNPRAYSLWDSYPGEDGWNNKRWSNAACIAEAGDSMPYEGSLSQQPEPASPTRDKVKPVPLSAVSLAGNSDYSLGGNSTAAPYTWPITTASVLPPAPCGAAAPSDDWLGSSGVRAHYQLTQGKAVYADVDLAVAPLTQAGKESLPDYLKDLPSACYSPHWFSYQDGMHYTDDSAFTRPADGTRLLDMGSGESGSPSYLEYWTVSDGYLLDFVYDPSTSVSTARKPMDSALAAAVTHINRVLHTHMRA